MLFGIIDLNIIQDAPYAGELGMQVIIAILNVCKDLNFEGCSCALCDLAWL
jgi:hypothetical protein